MSCWREAASDKSAKRAPGSRSDRGLGVWGFGVLGVLGFGFRVEGLGFRVFSFSGLGFRVWVWVF